jgi:hypothetical protein
MYHREECTAFHQKLAIHMTQTADAIAAPPSFANLRIDGPHSILKL